MAKAVLSVGYRAYVMDVDKALMVAQAIADSEQYERVYVPREARDDERVDYAHYIWPQEGTDSINLSLLSDNIYNIAKLAGKPPKKA